MNNENTVLAMNEIMLAKDENEVFGILEKYRIGYVEGETLIRVFNEAHKQRKLALEEIARKKLEIKVNNLKKKYDYLQNVRVEQFEHFYGHLLLDKRDFDFAPRFETSYRIAEAESKINRAEERKKRKAEQLGIDIETYMPQEVELSPISISLGYDFKNYEYIIPPFENAANCSKCERLIECEC